MGFVVLLFHFCAIALMMSPYHTHQPSIAPTACCLPCAAACCPGSIQEVGAGAGEGFTLNVPLPPGSGSGAYRAAFDQVG
jgi:hypothetical protein